MLGIKAPFYFYSQQWISNHITSNECYGKETLLVQKIQKSQKRCMYHNNMHAIPNTSLHQILPPLNRLYPTTGENQVVKRVCTRKFESKNLPHICGGKSETAHPHIAYNSSASLCLLGGWLMPTVCFCNKILQKLLKTIKNKATMAVESCVYW